MIELFEVMSLFTVLRHPGSQGFFPMLQKKET